MRVFSLGRRLGRHRPGRACAIASTLAGLTALSGVGCTSDHSPADATRAGTATAAISQPGSQVCTTISSTSFGPLRGALTRAQTRFTNVQTGTGTTLNDAAAGLADTIAKLDSMTAWMASSSLDASNASTAAGVNITMENTIAALETASQAVLTPGNTAAPSADVDAFVSAAGAAASMANDIGTDAGRCYVDWSGPGEPTSDPGQPPIVIANTCAGIDGSTTSAVRGLIDRAMQDSTLTPADDPFISYVNYFNTFATEARDALDGLTFALDGTASSAANPLQAQNIAVHLAPVIAQFALADWWALVADGNGAQGQMRRAWERTALAMDLLIKIQARAASCKARTTPPPTVGPGVVHSSLQLICGNPLVASGASRDAQGNATFGGLAYAANPVAGCEALFCDDQNNRIAGPSAAELTSAPPALAACTPLGSNVTSGPQIDPSTLRGTCTTSADCNADEACAALCADDSCQKLNHQCAKTILNASDDSGGNDCDPRELRLCPPDGAVGTVTAQDATKGWTPYVPGADLVPPPATLPQLEPYAPLTGIDACTIPGQIVGVVESTDHKEFPFNLGDDKWGIDIEPVFDHDLVIGKDNIGSKGEIGARAGVDAAAYVMGNKIDLVSATFDAYAGCAGHVGLTFKFLGDAIAASNDMQQLEVGTDPLPQTNAGTSYAQTKPKADTCDNAFKTRNAEVGNLRKLAYAARYTQDFFETNGAKPFLCERTNKDLNTSFDCDDPNAPSNIDIPGAWKKEYDDGIKKFGDVTDKETTLNLKQASFGGTVRVLELQNRYDQELFEVDIPLGPITLTIAADGYGEWHVQGDIQAGVRWDGNPFTALTLAADDSSGDLRAFAGPRVTPGMGIGVALFCGVGIPGVSVGIEGQVNLLSFDFPVDARVTVARARFPDPRDVQASAWAGDPVPSLPTNTAPQWKVGFLYNADMNVAALNGELDVALRINFFLFKKTFRAKIASWKGFQDTFHLAGGPLLGDPIDFGIPADKVAITKMKPLTADQAPANPNPNATFDTRLLGTDRECFPIK